MKIYISGQITGLPEDEYRRKFEKGEDLLSSIGLAPVSPLNNGIASSEWAAHMVRDIEMLLGCDAIYMLDNWEQSRGARIEHKIAEETNIIILYAIEQSARFGEIQILNSAVKKVTGLCFSEYTRVHRGRSALYARLVYTDICAKMGMDCGQIGALLNRDRTTIAYYRHKYADEIKYNPEFRGMVEKIAELKPEKQS